MQESKVIAITGANGFLGQHTIKAAISKGWKVHAIIRRGELIELIESLNAIPFIVQKFEIDALKKALSGCTAILHFANIVCGTKDDFENVNVLGMHNLIKAAEEIGVKKIIYPSGLGVDKYLQKDWANNEYFRSKFRAEQLLMNSQMNYAIFRPSYILGPNDELVPELIDQILDGIVKIAGDGRTPMQPIFVGDAVQAFLAAAEENTYESAIYNLVGLQTITMYDIVIEIHKTMKNLGFNIPEPEIKLIPYEKAPKELEICPEMVDVMRCDIIADGTIAAKTLKYELSPLKTAIKKAINVKLFPQVSSNKLKAILLLSGGIDSAVALYWALENNYELLAISINYKWRPEQEKIATRRLADITNIKLLEIPLPFIEEAVDSRFDGYPNPSAQYAPEGYIPLRNLIFYSIAAYFGKLYGYEYVIGGHISEDFELFRDSTPSFFQSLEALIVESRHEEEKGVIKFLFPLSKLNKIEVFELANRLEVPMELTWSCYGDYQKPCGRCSSCLKRLKALQNLGEKKQ